MDKLKKLLQILAISAFTVSIFATEHEAVMPECLVINITAGNVDEVIKHLEQYPDDINLKTKMYYNNYNLTALMLAIKSNSLQMFNAILSRTKDVNEPNNNGFTPLIYLSQANISEDNAIIFAELLLLNGAIIDEKTNCGNTALNQAVMYNYFNLSEFLITKKADPNIKNNRGYAPLISVVVNIVNIPEDNAILFIELLLQNGALLDSTDKDGNTVLMLAICNNYFNLSEFLIVKNADLNAVSCTGLTAFKSAIEKINQAKSEKIKEKAEKIAKILIAGGADTNVIHNNGHTSLTAAIFRVNIELVEFLLDNGVQIDFIIKQPKREDSYYTALNRAMFYKCNYSFKPINNTDEAKKEAKIKTIEYKNKLLAIIQLLVDRKACLKQIRVPNTNRIILSPLMSSSMYGDLQVVKLLVEAGSDINEKFGNVVKNGMYFAKEEYKKEVDKNKQQKFKKVIMYLTNHYNYMLNESRAIIAATVLDRNADVITDVTNIIGDYIHDPVEIDDMDIDKIKTLLRTADAQGIKDLLERTPNAVILEDEAHDTPLILMIKYYACDKHYGKLTQENKLQAMSIIINILQTLKKLDSDNKNTDNKTEEYLENELLKSAKVLNKLEIKVKLPEITNVLNQYKFKQSGILSLD